MRLIFALLLISMVGALGDFDQIPALPEPPQQMAGIGATLALNNGNPVVNSLLPDAAAAKAGIKAGDVIVEVDGKKTAGMQLNDVVNLIRGPKNTKVHLVVQRAGAAAPLQFDVVRRPLVIPGVPF